MRIFAAFTAESQTDFIDGFFVGKKISDMKDNRGNKMKDYILRQRLAEYDAKLDLVYRNFSEYVHLAEKAFYSSVTTSSSEQYAKFTKLVYGSIYRSVFIEEILENDKYDTVEKLLKLKPEQYVKFLEYIVDVIINRNKQLQDILQEENGHE